MSRQMAFSTEPQKKVVIRTHYNWKICKGWQNGTIVDPATGEVKPKPSLTVPDQSLTVRQLIERYASGKPLGGLRVGDYDDSPEDGETIPGWSKMDRLEKIQALKDAENELRGLKKSLNEKEAKRKEELDKAKKALEEKDKEKLKDTVKQDEAKEEAKQ